MLSEEPWMRSSQGLWVEKIQAQDEGKPENDATARIDSVLEMPDGPAKEEVADLIFDTVQSTPIREDFPYEEPETYEDILKAAQGSFCRNDDLPDDELYDRIYGGWLGRSAGCLLGKPVECWHRDRIVSFLKETDNYPLRYYMSSDVSSDIREKYGIVDEASDYGNTVKAWINNVSHMPEDDDLNYTIIGLLLLEKYGTDFTSEHVGAFWLRTLPVLHTCTAERVAYRNLLNSVYPPASASHRNPYREWIGAQIRADAYGYAMPGKPREAARLCYIDSALSHTKNGVYGSMWVGAMLAAAFFTDDMKEIIRIGMGEIPPKSRLSESLEWMLELHGNGVSLEKAMEEIHCRYDEKNEHDWCHVISNAVIVVWSLLYGEGDYEKTIGLATSIGFDTDCNAATAGSVFGVLHGAANLPEKWTGPLNDTVKSGINGLDLVQISSLAERTLQVAKKQSKRK